MTGCINSSSIYDRCPSVTTSNCVKFVGDSSSCLGICSDSSLTEVLNVVNTNLCSVVTAVDMSSVAVPSCLSSTWGTQQKNVLNFIQLLLTESCTLQSEIDTVNTALAHFDPQVTVDYRCCSNSCITNNTLPLSTTLQNIINCLCTVSQSVVTLQSLVNSFDSRITANELAISQINTQLTLLMTNGIGYQSQINTLTGKVQNLCSGNPC